MVRSTLTSWIFHGTTVHADLVVEEIDCSGHSRGRSLEYLFNGIVGHVIVGHVWDRHGNGTNPQLPHYWRRHFGVPDDSHPYHDYNPDDGAESADVTPLRSSPGYYTVFCARALQATIPFYRP